MDVKGFGHQQGADHRQKGQGQDLDGRVPVNKVTNRLGCQHHDRYRRDHGADHDADLVHHADCGDDRVQREDDVDDTDLDNRSPEQGGAGLDCVQASAGLLGRVGFNLQKDFV